MHKLPCYIMLSVLFSGCATGAVQAGELRINISDVDSGLPLADAVVELILPQGMQAQYQTPVDAQVDQQQKEFVDSVTVVTRGSRVSFPNSDDILHHVYSFSPAKVFQLPLYGRDESINFQESFDTTGVVELGCNIHDWMLAYIYVSETDFASKTDGSGVATLSNIPAGNYSVRVWHARAAAGDPALLHQVSIDEQGAALLRVALMLRRDIRLRRAPGPSRSRYR
jgi:plastocyanin